VNHAFALPALGKGFLSEIQRNPFRYLFPPRLEDLDKPAEMVLVAMAQRERFQFVKLNLEHLDIRIYRMESAAKIE
jgi:hypothetical protein